MEILTNNFFFIQALYRKALEDYLSNSLSLEKYAQELSDYPDNLILREYKEQTYYQKYSSFPFEYFYLRNNLYVERLSETDLKIFKKSYVNNDATITTEIQKVVQDTFTDIIKPMTDEYLEKYDQKIQIL